MPERQGALNIKVHVITPFYGTLYSLRYTFVHAHAYYVLVYGIVLLLEEVKLDFYWTNSAVDIDKIIMLSQ